jgi:hypothetical protein
MINLSGSKRIKLSTLIKWAAEKDDRAVSFSFNSVSNECPAYVDALTHEGSECEKIMASNLIDDISPKILGHKFADGEKL